MLTIFLIPPNKANGLFLPQQTMDWKAIAEQIIIQIDIEKDEKIISIVQPDMFEKIIPHIRYAVMKAGGVDMGVIEVIDNPYPKEWREDIIREGFKSATAGYVEMLEDIDVAIMMPGTNPVHPAYKAMQILLKNKKGSRRTIHFHWTDPYSPSGNISGLTGINVLPGHPPPPMQVINELYQNAVLKVDLKSIARHQSQFAKALRSGKIRITSPYGTDISFLIGNRNIIVQNGDASAKRMRNKAAFLEREVEIPVGAVRVAPIEESVNGKIVYPFSAWNGRSVQNATIYIENGKIISVSALKGSEHIIAELDGAPPESKYFREFALGFNPFLDMKKTKSWIGYYGYGSGVVRLGLGNNSELGGKVSGNYFRWRDLLTDCTITINGTVWVKNGVFIK